MKKGLIFIFVLLCSVVVAQDEIYYHPDSAELAVKKSPFQFGLSTGFVTGTNFNSEVSFAQYIAPNLSYDFSDKFTLSAGFMLVNGTDLYSGNHFRGADYRSNHSPYYRPLNSFGYVMGSYKVDDNLTLKGAIYNEFKNIGNNDNAYNNFSPSTGYALGFEYKVSENFHIGMQISKGNGLHSSPFAIPSSNGFSSPLFSPVGMW